MFSRSCSLKIPNFAEAHSLLALCLLENRDSAHDATREAEHAIHLEPDSGFAHYARASVLVKRNQFEEASLRIQEALRLDPDQSHYHALHALILAQQSQWPAALDAASRGLSLDPEDTSCASLRHWLSNALGEKERRSSAGRCSRFTQSRFGASPCHARLGPLAERGLSGSPDFLSRSRFDLNQPTSLLDKE